MKKLVALALTLAMILTCVSSLADIGTADAPVKVTYLLKDMPADSEAGQAFCKAVNAKLAEKGIHVELTFIDSPAGKYIDVMPIAVVNEVISADIYWYQSNTETTAATQGFLEDLTELAAGSENLQAIMGEHDKVRLANSPYLLWATNLPTYTPVLRGDWAAKLPSCAAVAEDPTVDNWVALLKDLKGEGMAKYPVTFYGSHGNLDSIFGAAFGVTTTLVNQDGKWVYKQVTEGMKNLLAFYHELYAQELIDPEYLTNTWDVAEEKFYSGTSAMLIGKAGAIVDVYDTNIKNAQGAEATVVVLPPAKSDLGQAYSAIDTSKEERGIAVNADSANKEAVAAIIDFMASPEGRILDLYGVEGMHYNIEDGKLVRIEGAPEWYSTFFDSLLALDKLPVEAPAPLGDAGLKSLDMAAQYFVADNKVNLPSEYAAYWDAMINLFNEYAVDVIRGDKNTEGDWDAFVAAWNEAGGNQVSEYLATVMK